MLPKINGRVAWKFEEPNYDIDNIIGVENIKLSDIEQMKKVCMTDYDPDFISVVQDGDVLVGAENFGYGHPHYVAFKALRALGVRTVFAESFNPSFYKGEVANGVALIEVPGILEAVERWSTVTMDWDREEVTVDGKTVLKCSHVPQRTKDLVECGNLINYIREKRL
nr:hypothetical protein [uncultured Oscillibacter sp.]